MSEYQEPDDQSTEVDARPLRRLILASTLLLLVLVVMLAQLGSVQDFVRRRVLAERPEPSLRVTDAFVPAGDTMFVYVVNEGLGPAHIDRAEIHVERIWKLRRVLTGPDGGPPEGGWDVPISAARAPYVVGVAVDSRIPPDGMDSLRVIMRPEGNAYFVLLRARLLSGDGEISVEGPPLLHFFPGAGGVLPTRSEAEQYARIEALGLDPVAAGLEFSQAKADAWNENWRQVEEVRELGVRMSASATDIIERLSWR